MTVPFSKIGIIGKPSATHIQNTLTTIYQFLQHQGYEVILDPHSATLLNVPTEKHRNLKDLSQTSDLVIAVGGDGTFLSAARAVAEFNVPLVGVNLGRLGFLVEISPTQVIENLRQILDGHYITEQRSILRAKIIREQNVIREETAFNEVVVHRWITSSMIELITYVNGQYLNSQRSDGLVVSTPTGSTAYALSGGGPILHPTIAALVLVPLNPHTLSNRPIVVDDRCEIKIKFCQEKPINALVTCDNVEIPDVTMDDTIVITKDPSPITILHLEDYDYFHVLREKMDWSVGYTNSNC